MSNPIKVYNWRPLTPGSHSGYFSATLPDGSTVDGCSIMETGGHRFISGPGRIVTPDGKVVFLPIVQFPDRRAHNAFCRQVRKAVQDHIDAESMSAFTISDYRADRVESIPVFVPVNGVNA